MRGCEFFSSAFSSAHPVRRRPSGEEPNILFIAVDVLTSLRPTTTGVYVLLPWFRDVAELKDLTTPPQHFRNKNFVRCFLLTVSFMDAQHGRVLDALEKSGHAENTVIVLWSEHG